MTSNPYDDNYDEDAQPVFDGPEEDGPPEDIIPEDTPAPHVNWMCTGVAAKGLKRKSPEAHMLPAKSNPDQPTTDAKGRYMEGSCPECNARTIWKKVTL